MNISFRDRIMSERGDIIYKIVATDNTNRRAFYCVIVLPSKEDAFKAAIASGEINFDDHGIVIASCYGEEPTEEVKKLLKEKHGFDV